MDDVLIDGAQLPVDACLDACGTNLDADMDFAANPLGFTDGTTNHVRWPLLCTADMLAFFRAHPAALTRRPLESGARRCHDGRP